MNSVQIVTSIIFIFAFGCEKSSENKKVIDAVANVSVVDKQGRNLLSYPSILDTKEIKVFYMVNGELQLQNKSNLDAPRGFEIIKNQKNEDVIKLFLNTDIRSPITLISYDDSDPDTIKCEYNRQNGSTICTKIWYNNLLKWDVSNPKYPTEREFTIIKE